MIICNSKNYIFVHIHKTGGTSVTRALAPTTCWNDIILGGTPYGQKNAEVWGDKWDLGKHSFAEEIKRLVEPTVWSEYFTFSFVRHPVDRAVSLYTSTRRVMERNWHWRWTRHFIPRHGGGIWQREIADVYLESESFSSFIRHPKFGTVHDTQPQVEFLSDAGSTTPIVDEIGKVEQFQEDFDTICSRIGVEASLPHVNASQEREVNVTEEDRRVLAEIYEDDFDVLGYAPDGSIQ
jgi:hypothetical protein